MRKIQAAQIAVFFLLIGLDLAITVALAAWTIGRIPLGDFRGVVVTAVGILLFYAVAIATYRLFLRFFPLHEGGIEERSQQEFVYHVYLLFYLLLFYPVMRGGVVPVPMLRLFYLALGAKLGDNTYSSGIILDPPFIEIGSNSIVGQFALVIPHVIEGKKLAHYRIRIGNNVTVGAHAVILPGVTVGDNAIVATGAIVQKGTRIGANEVWGGVPARRLRTGGNDVAKIGVDAR